MNISTAVTTRDDYIRITISVIEFRHEMADQEALIGPYRRLPRFEDKFVHAPVEAPMIAKTASVEFDLSLSTESQTVWQWISSNKIRLTGQLLVFIATYALHNTYMHKCHQMKTSAEREICKEGVQTLCESNLAQCDMEAATSLTSGAQTIDWMQLAVFSVGWAAGHYAAWFVQGWVTATFFKNKKGHELQASKVLQ